MICVWLRYRPRDLVGKVPPWYFFFWNCRIFLEYVKNEWPDLVENAFISMCKFIFGSCLKEDLIPPNLNWFSPSSNKALPSRRKCKGVLTNLDTIHTYMPWLFLWWLPFLSYHPPPPCRFWKSQIREGCYSVGEKIRFSPSESWL